MRQPRVSIGLPVRNGEKHLPAALDSLLGQTFQDFELVISDNASTDGTGEICAAYAARDPRIRYSHVPRNVGAATNFNRVFGLCKGEYFKWAAHDDLHAPTFLERCLEALDADPAAALAFGRRRFIREDDGSPESQRQTESYHHLSFARLTRLPGNCFSTFTFGLGRRTAWERTRLRGSFPASELVLAAEMCLAGRFVEVPEELFFQRRHVASDGAWSARSRSKKAEAIWLDPANQGQRMLPGLRLLNEHLVAIQRANVSFAARTAAFAAMPAYVTARFSQRRKERTLFSRIRQEIAGLLPSGEAHSHPTRFGTHSHFTAHNPPTGASPERFI